MANTYTHRIISLKKENGNYLNTIKSFVVVVTASNGSNQISDEYKFDLQEPDVASFVDYQDLQETDLIFWLTNSQNEYMDITQDIDKKLQESIQDTVESNFPWS